MTDDTTLLQDSDLDALEQELENLYKEMDDSLNSSLASLDGLEDDIAAFEEKNAQEIEDIALGQAEILTKDAKAFADTE